jgi:hypothetical protein
MWDSSFPANRVDSEQTGDATRHSMSRSIEHRCDTDHSDMLRVKLICTMRNWAWRIVQWRTPEHSGRFTNGQVMGPALAARESAAARRSLTGSSGHTDLATRALHHVHGFSGKTSAQKFCAPPSRRAHAAQCSSDAPTRRFPRLQHAGYGGVRQGGDSSEYGVVSAPEVRLDTVLYPGRSTTRPGRRLGFEVLGAGDAGLCDAVALDRRAHGPGAT